MIHSPVLQSLEYRGPQGRMELPPTRGSIAFKIALWCWALPLMAGISDFALWAIVRFERMWFSNSGLCIILFGILATLVGAIAVLVLLATRWPKSVSPFRQAILPALILIGLLASNFVVAGLVIQAVLWIDPAFMGHHGLS